MFVLCTYIHVLPVSRILGKGEHNSVVMVLHLCYVCESHQVETNLQKYLYSSFCTNMMKDVTLTPLSQNIWFLTKGVCFVAI